MTSSEQAPPTHAQVFQGLFPTSNVEPGPWLGAITDRSVRVWLRSSKGEPIKATLRVAGTAVAEATLTPDPAHDFVDIADLAGDHSFASQAFEVEVAGVRRTAVFAPVDDTPSEFSFLVGSCNQPYVYHDGRAELGPANDIYGPMVRTLEQENARFALLVGDQTYADGVENISVPALVQAHPELTDDDILGLYRHVHRLYLGQGGLNRVLAKVPTMMVWDDHEVFDCWGSQTEITALDRRIYKAAETAYVEYEHAHNPGAVIGQGRPFQYKFWYGDVGFFVLDLRSQRDYSEGLLIGEDQWQSLQEFLVEAGQRGTRTVFIASSIPVVHFSPRMAYWTSYLPNRKASLSRDRWDSAALSPHRRRLFSLLFDWQTAASGRKVILLSGDVHAAAAFRVHQKRGPGVVTQWTSSAFCTPGRIGHVLINKFGTAFTSYGDDESDSKQIGLEARNNFGIVRVTPTPGGGHTVRFDVHKVVAHASAVKRSFSDEI